MADRFPGVFPPAIAKGQFNERSGFDLDQWAKSVQEAVGGSQGTPDTPSEIEADATADAGTSQASAPSDHIHSVNTAGPSVLVGATAVTGTGSSLMRSDSAPALGIGTTRYDTLIHNGTIWQRKRYAPTPVDLVTAQLAAATGVLFTSTANIVIRSFRIVNTSAGARTVNLYIRPLGAGTRYPIMPYNTVIAAGAQYATDPAALFIPLEATDTIEGDADTGAVCDISVDGENWSENAETVSRVYEGLVSNVLATLATVPAAERWLIRSIATVNVSAGAVTIDLRIVRNATTVKVLSVSVPVGAMISPLEYFIVLQVGDTIEAVAGAAASISVVIGATVTIP